MAVSASAVKELREKTGAGMLDCKKALEEANGDITKATELLREKGLAAAANKAGRAATEGVVEAYIHAGGRIGVLVEINCETDFVGKTDQFKEFARDIAMHIAASSPRYVSREEVPQAEVEKAYSVKYLMPSSSAAMVARFTAFIPVWCPTIRGSPRLLAQRPLPSIMMATCSGTLSMDRSGKSCGSFCFHHDRTRLIILVPPSGFLQKRHKPHHKRRGRKSLILP